jgi:hypothetical protein
MVTQDLICSSLLDLCCQISRAESVTKIFRYYLGGLILFLDLKVSVELFGFCGNKQYQTYSLNLSGILAERSTGKPW